MARKGPDGTWICPLCERALHEFDFAADAYRERTGRGPGRCRDCEREYSRALVATSPTGKYGDADHPVALEMAREVCREHAWGQTVYAKRMVRQAEIREGREDVVVRLEKEAELVERKMAVREARLARRDPDWEPERFGG